MSALRISIPGQPTTLVDLGPSVGRRTMTRGAVMGGAIVVPTGLKRPTSLAQIEAARANGAKR